LEDEIQGAPQAAANANHPYTATALYQQVGAKHIYHVNQLIKQVAAETGCDIKSFDNIYHVYIKTGQAEGSRVRKYSDAAVALLKKVLAGAKYDIPKHVIEAAPKTKAAIVKK